MTLCYFQLISASSPMREYPTRIIYNSNRTTSISSKEHSVPQRNVSKEVLSHQESTVPATPSEPVPATPSPTPILCSSTNVEGRPIIISDDEMDECIANSEIAVENSFDCGVHVIANAQIIANTNTCHTMSSLSPNTLTSMRDEIATTILTMSSDGK